MKSERESLHLIFIFLNRVVLYCITDEYVDDNSRDGNNEDDDENNDYYDESDDDNSSNSHSKVGYSSACINSTIAFLNLSYF